MIKKINKKVRLSFYAVLSVLAVFLPYQSVKAAFFLPFVAAAGGAYVANWIVGNKLAEGAMNIVATLLQWILQGLAYLLTTLVGLLVEIGKWNIFTDAAAVETGWLVLRDISNMFFVVVLLLISFGTILKIDQFQLKSWLPKVVLMAILVNFSKLITGFLIEVSQVVMLTFVAAYQQAGAGNILQGFQIPSLTSVFTTPPVTGEGRSNVTGLDLGQISTALLWAIIYTIVALVVVIAFLFIFVIRIVALWLLIIFSPLAFVLSAVPGGQQYFSMWWKNFSQYVVIGPVLAFFLWLSLATLPTLGDIIKTAPPVQQTQVDTNGYAQSIPAFGVTEATSPAGFLVFAFSTVMLVMSLYFAQQIGGAIGSIAGKGISSVQTLGKNAFGLRPLARYIDERNMGRGKLPMNPFVHYQAWSQQREDTKRERTAPSIGYARNLARFGYRNVATAKFQQWTGQQSLLTNRLAKYKQEEEELRETLRVGTGGDVQEQKEKYKTDRNEAKKRYEEVSSRQKDLSELSNLFNLDPSSLTTEQKSKFTELSKKYSNVSKENISEELSNINEVTNKARKAFEDADKKSNLTDKEVSELLKSQYRAELLSKQVDIEAVNKGYMTTEEANDNLTSLNNQIQALEKVIKELEADGIPTHDEDNRKASLVEKQGYLQSYLEKMKEGKGTNEMSKDELSTAVKSRSNSEKKTVLSKLNKEKKLASIRANTKSLTQKERESLSNKYRSTKDDIASAELSMASMTIPQFYRDQAQRALTAEKYKELQTNDSGELVRMFKLAHSSKDRSQMRAIMNKLASDANFNELLHSYGYDSGYEGFVNFFDNVVTPAFGSSEQDIQDARRTAMDISYVNESVNHWDMARLIKVDPITGKLVWLSEDEHADEAGAEIDKMNPQSIKRNVGRLGLGGEHETADGKRLFKVGKLALRQMKSQKGNYIGGATAGGDTQLSLAKSLHYGMSQMRSEDRMKENIDDLYEVLGAYIENRAEPKKK